MLRQTAAPQPKPALPSAARPAVVGEGSGRQAHRRRCARRRRPTFGAAIALLGALCGLAAQNALAEIIHRERSLYQTVLVTKNASILCLQFGQRRMQSCLDQRRPNEMELTYTKMMMASLLLNPSPNRMLIIGLGGGVLPMALAALRPQASVEVVEIDPAVVKVARRYFGFAESDNLRVHVQDARVFTRRASQAGPAYDLIMLDAFGADYIPEHLMTREFLQEVKALLQEDGVLAANTFATSKLYDHESVTYRDVFGPFFNFDLPRSGNRVILAGRRTLPSLMTLSARAKALAAPLAPYGIPIQTYPARFSTRADWDPGARVLTDQYAPANLLQGE